MTGSLYLLAGYHVVTGQDRMYANNAPCECADGVTMVNRKYGRFNLVQCDRCDHIWCERKI